MANVVSQTRELVIDTYYVDGDNRTITIKDPISNTSTLNSKIAALNTMIQADNLLIGDQTGATFGKISSAKVRTKKTTYIDIEPDETA